MVKADKFSPGTAASDFVLFKILLLSCTSTSGGAENLGGGGGGMALGGGGAIPLDVGLINFLGAGIVDTFLTMGSSDCSLAFKGSNSCNELEFGTRKHKHNF